MTKAKPLLPADLGPIHPDFVYRRSSPIARAVIGLGDTQTDEAIANGELPPPVKLTESGRATGWIGAQLIELQRKRLAKAEAAAAERRAAAEAESEEKEATAEPPKVKAAGK
jgi:predicted DNA-binding transcriptional regulator AlpA